jgi:hypothetical protein
MASMSNESIILLVAACSGVFGVAAWIGLLAVPAWQSYWRVAERIGAVFLSLYVFAAFIGIGAALGALVVWLWAS